MRSISFLFLLLISCSKKHSYVEANVYAAGSNLPLAGVEVTITKSFHYNQDAVIATGRTDENGYFKVSYDRSRSTGYQYYCKLSTDGGFNQNTLTSGNTKLTVYMVKRFYAKFRVKNNLSADLDIKIDKFSYKKIRVGQDTLLKNVLTFSSHDTQEVKWDYILSQQNTSSGNLVTIVNPAAGTDTVIHLIEID